MMNEIPLDISIRVMTLEDIDAVHDLDQRSFSTPWPKKSFIFELTENNTARLWVAERVEKNRKEIVGMIICWLLMDEVHVATLAVDKAYQRKKVANTLLCKALISMMNEGAISATLDVREGNLPAQAMYRKFGFELIGRRPGYYKNNSEAALLMTLGQLNEEHLLAVPCLSNGSGS